jgi:hypothetical protein
VKIERGGGNQTAGPGNQFPTNQMTRIVYVQHSARRQRLGAQVGRRCNILPLSPPKLLKLAYYCTKVGINKHSSPSFHALSGIFSPISRHLLLGAENGRLHRNKEGEASFAEGENSAAALKKTAQGLQNQTPAPALNA